MIPLLFALALEGAPAVLALVDRAESLRRAGRLDEAALQLDREGPGAAGDATETERLHIRLARARIAYYRGSLAGTPHDAVIADLRAIVAQSERVTDAALLADARDLAGALAGFERSPALRQKAGYAIYIAPSLIAGGDVWKDMGDAKKAREYFERARVEADRIGAARLGKMAAEAIASLDAASRR